MVNTNDLRKLLAKEMPQYEFTYNERFKHGAIIAKKDTYRGAEIHSFEDRVQLLPMIPTFKGKMLFGSGIGFAPMFIKNYDDVALDVFEYLKTLDLPYKVEYVNTRSELLVTERGKKIEGVVLTVFGIAIVAVSVFLYFEFQKLETQGGEMSIHWIVALLYENLGKTVAAGMVALVGIVMFFDGIKKIRNKGE